jgi:hypothetical protein
VCNFVHDEKELEMIPEEGTGWKLFVQSDRGEFLQLVTCSSYHFPRMDGWVSWDEKQGKRAGFCFFLTEKEAVEALKEWEGHTLPTPEGYIQEVRKIEYEGGIGEQMEGSFCGRRSFKVALCKKFRMI